MSPLINSEQYTIVVGIERDILIGLFTNAGLVTRHTAVNLQPDPPPEQ